MKYPTPKYERKATEKIWNILQEIEEIKQYTAEKEEIRLPFMPPGFQGTMFDFDRVVKERHTVLRKLEASKAIIEIGHSDSGVSGSWFIKTSLNYKKVFSSTKKKYEASSREYVESKSKKEIEVKDPIYEVKYSEITREITINNILLSKPDFYKENEVVFNYIYKRPKQRISIQSIKNHVKTELDESMTKSIHKIVENLGFKGDLKQVFFDVSSKGVYFRNPVTKDELDEIGIKYLQLKN